MKTQKTEGKDKTRVMKEKENKRQRGREEKGEGRGKEKGFYMTKTSVSSSVKSSLMVVESLRRERRRNWV